MEIIDILLRDFAKRLAEKGISFQLRPDAKEFLVDKGFDPSYGARPLKRALQRHLEDPLAEEILRGEASNNILVVIYKHETEDKLAFEIVPKKMGEIAEEPFKASR